MKNMIFPAVMYVVVGIFSKYLLNNHLTLGFFLFYLEIAAFAGYFVAKWYGKRSNSSLKAMRIVAWFSLFSWTYPAFGMFTSCATLGFRASGKLKEDTTLLVIAIINIALSIATGGSLLNVPHINTILIVVGLAYVIIGLCILTIRYVKNAKMVLGLVFGSIGIILLSGFLFYWFQYRPASIKRSCSLTKSPVLSDIFPGDKRFIHPATETEYQNCLHQNGL